MRTRLLGDITLPVPDHLLLRRRLILGPVDQSKSNRARLLQARLHSALRASPYRYTRMRSVNTQTNRASSAALLPGGVPQAPDRATRPIHLLSFLRRDKLV